MPTSPKSSKAVSLPTGRKASGSDIYNRQTSFPPPPCGSALSSTGSFYASTMGRGPQTRFRLLAAWVCLLAVASLFAPLAGAAWSASAMDCCTGDHCTIPRHHHRKAAAHLDCDHDNAGGLTACSMSCCQDEERPLATAMIFVMPLPAMSSAPLHVRPAVEAPRSIAIPRSVQPLVPPPRSIASL